jgi:hypothetical protein
MSGRTNTEASKRESLSLPMSGWPYARLLAAVLAFLTHNGQRCDFEHFIWAHKVERIGADFSQLLNEVRSILDPAFDCFFGEMSRLGV